jgi:hypothetical protein
MIDEGVEQNLKEWNVFEYVTRPAPTSICFPRLWQNVCDRASSHCKHNRIPWSRCFLPRNGSVQATTWTKIVYQHLVEQVNPTLSALPTLPNSNAYYTH